MKNHNKTFLILSMHALLYTGIANTAHAEQAGHNHQTEDVKHHSHQEHEHENESESLEQYYSQQHSDEHDHGDTHEHAHKQDSHNDHDDHKDHEDEHHHGDEHHHDESSTIPAALAKQVGIKTSSAGPVTLHHQTISYGTLTTAPEQLSHVRARFAGVIYSVKANIGDYVQQGDVLAEIESNESLKRYAILAPISGTIIQRHANAGEMTGDQELFSIARYDTLWAELKVFPAQKQKIKAGQEVHIVLANTTIAATINHLVPAGDNKPYVFARAEVSNTLGDLSPGVLVEGRITTETHTVNLAVANEAIQTLPDGTGVFVQQGDSYTFKPLQLGKTDGRFTEVLAGLHAGEHYVSQNSFLIKADILKAGAEHVH